MATGSNTSLPDFAKFDVDDEPTSLHVAWKKWITRFENLIVALEITDDNRKRVLLYYAGPEVHEIYNTLVPT